MFGVKSLGGPRNIVLDEGPDVPRQDRGEAHLMPPAFAKLLWPPIVVVFRVTDEQQRRLDFRESLGENGKIIHFFVIVISHDCKLYKHLLTRACVCGVVGW